MEEPGYLDRWSPGWTPPGGVPAAVGIDYPPEWGRWTSHPLRLEIPWGTTSWGRRVTVDTAPSRSRDAGTTARPIELDQFRSMPAAQQPDWGDPWLVDKVSDDLAGMPPLVGDGEVFQIRQLLAEVAAGRLHVVQAGDCAEDPAECAPQYLARKVGLLEMLANALQRGCATPVLRVGRIAGQFAKPRSRPTDAHGGSRLPAFRGMLVNDAAPDEDSRRPDPLRMLTCYQAACSATRFLRRHRGGPTGDPRRRVWTSHEALVLDYELPALRRDSDGRLLLTSTHWPWIGDRTRQPNGAHVAMLAAVANPVACKVGPALSPTELVALCERLDPERLPGRLTLIARLGAERCADLLPALAAAVERAGHPVIWMCDPLHANTTTTPGGRKTRLLPAVLAEVHAFRQATAAAGVVAGGLHLETTPDAVTECVGGTVGPSHVGEYYTSLCDPRLNPGQALRVVSAWSE